jgi:hypothetical protein
MRVLMGLIRDRHGTYYAQRRVPERLQEGVARVLNSDKQRQVFLKKSLGTKSAKAANVAATHVLASFDRILADAETLLKERPVVSSLNVAQIKRITESYYASVLHDDEEERREGTGSEPIFQGIARQLAAAGVMRQALDVAADRVPVTSRTPATKAKMAQRIVRLAHEGVTDVQQLVAVAVAEGLEPAL